VLCLGEGEGRNAVFLARRGHAVTAVDQSAVGLAKARPLAARHGVVLTTHTADLGTFTIAPGAWAGIVATFVHLPPALRARVHRAAAAGLRPGGGFILEAYHPDQVHHRTGGPVDAPELLMTLEDLRADLAGLDLVVAQQRETDLDEGSAHQGRSAVVQVFGQRPG
jgi:SAM-dependent methyltransferase